MKEQASPVYVDGTLCAVPSDKKHEYIEFATQVAELFLREGAIEVVDNWGDDVPDGKVNSLRSAVLCKPGETVVFSWISWPSKAVRDAAWDVLMADPELSAMSLPYDGSRMIFGGFEQIVPRP